MIRATTLDLPIGFASLAHRLWSPAADRLHRIIAALTDPYRPEKHYMRGPGPKWHAKHGGRGV